MIQKLTSNVKKSYNIYIQEQQEKFQKFPLQKELYKAAIYHLSNYGKLLRPSLMAILNEDLGGQYKDIKNYALSLELVHNYSLVHDDLPSMDNDDYRRGELTVHKKFNEAIAVLLGDYLLNESFITLTRSSDVNIHAVKYMAEKFCDMGMIGGQVIDMNPEYIDSVHKLIEMYEKKTAALFKSAFVVPAIVAGLDDTVLKDLEHLGHYFGIYFQIKDDISDKKEDQKNNKKTVFYFYDNDEVENLLEKYLYEINFILEKYNLTLTKNYIGALYE